MTNTQKANLKLSAVALLESIIEGVGKKDTKLTEDQIMCILQSEIRPLVRQAVDSGYRLRDYLDSVRIQILQAERD